jgi:exodeoxyribonuclease-3
MVVVTWNVNGIRARQQQLVELLKLVEPDVLCLQEIKANPEQIPFVIFESEGYWSYWHGAGGYSGVALLVRKEACANRPDFCHPEFDYETRIATITLNAISIASVYVPNGGRDYPGKLRFLESLGNYAALRHAAGETLVICGDLNVTRSDMDVHPKERRAKAVGQRPDERALFEQLLNQGLVDVGRTLEPENDQLFTWWAPWRNMRQRNIGWRLDYFLVSQSLWPRVRQCRVLHNFGTSDHGPVVLETEG